MPSKRYAPLSAVLSWIAFGEWTDADTHWDCYAQAKSQLEDAMARFSDTASDGLIFVRGKLAQNSDVDPVALDTDDIPAARFHDFRQYDLTCCGLRYGEGLLGFPEESENSFNYVHKPSGRRDFYRDVVVRREDVDREFPASTVGPKVTPEEVVRWCRDWVASGRGNNMNTAWPEFSKDPRFKGCSRDDWLRPAWNEAKTKR
jgi:hypothetical protein